MQGTVKLTMTGYDAEPNPLRSRIQRGPLVLPDGFSVDGQLVAFGEDDTYLHCIISNSGLYYGIFKSEDENHIWQHLVRLNGGA